MKRLLPIALALLAASPVTCALEEGQSPPPCKAELANKAGALDLNTYKGKVVLIDFWATWCPPCKKSMPFLNSLRNQHSAAGFEVIAINVDEDSEEAKRYLAANPVDYQMSFDPSGNCPEKFAVKAMPSSYLVDKSGKVRRVHLGFRDEDQSPLREQVSALVAE